jgi:hypothetical protein
MKKKIQYFMLLAVELFIGTLLLMSLWSNNMVITCGITIALTVGLAVWQIVRLIRAKDEAVKKKSRRNIALILLLPIAAFGAVFLYVVIGLIIAFA